MNINMASALTVFWVGGVGLSLVCMFIVACLLAVLFLVRPVAGFRASWRDVCDTLCVLAVLAMSIVVVFVFSV